AGYASYISLSGHFLAGQGTLHVLTWVSTGAFAVLSVILPFTQVALPQTSQGYLAALGLCAVCTLISLALLLKGTRLVQRTTDISVMVMLEIGSTLLLVQLLLDTQIQPYEWAGALMVFSAAVTVFVYGSRQRPVT
ncbi:MAG: EamA family transporter, partial [Pseudomonadales bacterium]